MSEEDATQVGMRLQPCREIHFVADDRVVDALIAAEVSYGAEAGVDPDAKLEEVLLPRSRHSACRSRIRCCIAIA